VSEALDEYAEDSKDEAIQALCSDIAGAISAERASELQSAGSSCLAKSACEDFVPCVVPLSMTRWKS
jgi:hypothetical protein